MLMFIIIYLIFSTNHYCTGCGLSTINKDHDDDDDDDDVYKIASNGRKHQLCENILDYAASVLT